MRRKLTGIRPWKGKWQAYVQVNGKTYAKSYPLTTPLQTMRDWRDDQKKKFRPIAPASGSFSADIAAYLKRVEAMPTFKQRAAHLELWAEALGRDRSRASITPGDIDAVMQRWLTTPSRPAKGRPSGTAGIAPGTVRKRRTALRSFFNKLDGKQGTNPVRASSAPRGSKPEARGLDYHTIDRILDQMPESLTKRRVAVLVWTGLPPGLLATVLPTDLNLSAGTVRVRPRRKGAGVEARTLPLLPQAKTAWAAFHRARAYGPFAIESANRSFKRGCARANVRGVHLYDLRHSFGALVYSVTRDLATVARFLLHANIATTARYAQSANQDVDRDAAARVGARLQGEGLSRKPVRLRKSRKRKHLRRAS